MKISNSKKQLAEIIHENGGWRGGAEFAAQGGNHGHVGFASVAPVRNGKVWDMTQGFAGKFLADEILPNWHQTILSRDEYFHLYPVAETAPEPVVEAEPTIEQLAADYRNRKDYADRKQQEADAAKSDAEAKLAELVAAGKALGLVLSVADAPEPELVVTDWWDLQIGDEVECIRPNVSPNKYRGRIGRLIGIDEHDSGTPYLVDFGECAKIWCHEVEFVRRPAQGGANA